MPIELSVLLVGVGTFLLICVITLIASEIIYLNSKNIYSNGTGYYRWRAPEIKNGVTGNWWRPVTRRWFGVWEASNLDFWATNEDSYNWRNVNTGNWLVPLSIEDYEEIKSRLKEFNNIQCKETRLKFITNL